MEIIDLIKKLKWNQYMKYLRYMLGYSAFLKGDSFIPCANKNMKNIIGVYVNKGNNDKTIYSYKSEDHKKFQISIESKQISNVKIQDVIDINSNYSFIFLFSLTMNYSNKGLKDIVLNKVYSFRNIKKDLSYSFVVGAGISMDYGSKSWNDLKKDMKKGIADILGINLPSLSYETYDLCQDMKNLDVEKFNDILYKSIYDEYNKGKKNDEENTTCKAIAKLVCKQAPYLLQQRILSFNYDDFLTREIEKINADVCDVYRTLPKSNLSIEVVHLHGLIKDDRKFYDIVLTTDDYYSAYKSNSYVYKTFKEHLLKNINIFVGNSLSDYEELKVLRDNFEEYYSSFHYALMLKGKDAVSDLYKSLRLIKYGIICLWYNDKYELSKYINELEHNH